MFLSILFWLFHCQQYTQIKPRAQEWFFFNLAVPWEHQKISPGSRDSLAGVACQIYNYLQVCGKLLNFSLSVEFPVCQEFFVATRLSVRPSICLTACLYVFLVCLCGNCLSQVLKLLIDYSFALHCSAGTSSFWCVWNFQHICCCCVWYICFFPSFGLFVFACLTVLFYYTVLRELYTRFSFFFVRPGIALFSFFYVWCVRVLNHKKRFLVFLMSAEFHLPRIERNCYKLLFF